ncbi:MAG: YceI family protein [Terrimicrobiaceae bacterium]
MMRDRQKGENQSTPPKSPARSNATRQLSVKPRLALLLIIACSAADECASSSPPEKYVNLSLDRKECKVTFSLPAVLHTVRGTFEVREGNFRLNVGSGKITGRVVVDVRSGNTGEKERDRLMHQEVLDSDQFPEAVFSADHLAGQLALSGDSQIGVHGVLRIHGQDHNVTLPATVSLQDGRFTARSRLSIPYVKWGMKDPSNLVLRVGKTVEVEIRVAGTVRRE